MKVFRIEHIDYNEINVQFNDPHKLLLDVMNSDMEKYPCPPSEVFQTETISCFKTASLANDFYEEMEGQYDDDYEYYDDLLIPQLPYNDYIIKEMDLPEEDIVWTDHFQVIFKYHLPHN